MLEEEVLSDEDGARRPPLLLWLHLFACSTIREQQTGAVWSVSASCRDVSSTWRRSEECGGWEGVWTWTTEFQSTGSLLTQKSVCRQALVTWIWSRQPRVASGGWWAAEWLVPLWADGRPDAPLHSGPVSGFHCALGEAWQKVIAVVNGREILPLHQRLGGEALLFSKCEAARPGDRWSSEEGHEQGNYLKQNLTTFCEWKRLVKKGRPVIKCISWGDIFIMHFIHLKAALINAVWTPFASTSWKSSSEQVTWQAAEVSPLTDSSSCHVSGGKFQKNLISVTLAPRAH